MKLAWLEPPYPEAFARLIVVSDQLKNQEPSHGIVGESDFGSYNEHEISVMFNLFFLLHKA